MKTRVLAGLSLTSTWLLAGMQLHAAEQALRPNIIVILTDDHGWADLGAQGIQQDIRTPNLDALATGGLRAVNGYVTAPQCVPSRAGLMSGRYQNRLGVESNEQYQQPGGLDGFNASATIAMRLRSVGYVTGMAGKWHLGSAEKITDHGFDKVFHKHSQAAGYWNMNLEGRDVPAGSVTEAGYHLDHVADFACAFIRRHAEQPFFFYLAVRGPHTPLDAPAQYTSRFPGKMPERRRQALAMISAIDDGIGRITSTLREQMLEERTLIFFMGDNGAPLKIHKLDSPLHSDAGGWDGSLNAPLNGEKGMLSEGGIRVPWLVYWKGRIPGGQVFYHPVTSLDVAATAASVAGLTVGSDELDGVDLIPHFTGANLQAPHDTLYWRWIGQAALRQGRWKLLVAGQRSYLFDLDSDQEEQHNLIERHPAIAARLRGKLEDWGAELKPPGISTKPMSRAGENYFDYYLDGIINEPQRGQPDGYPGTNFAWVVRNGSTEVRDDSLRVVATAEDHHDPFLAFTGFKVRGPATAVIQVRVRQHGNVGLAWRVEGQRDFPKNQTVFNTVQGSDEFQTLALDLPSIGELIHLRLLLPAGTSDLKSLALKSRDGGSSITLWPTDSRR